MQNALVSLVLFLVSICIVGPFINLPPRGKEIYKSLFTDDGQPLLCTCPMK